MWNGTNPTPRYCVQYATVQFYVEGPSAPNTASQLSIDGGRSVSRLTSSDSLPPILFG